MSEAEIIKGIITMKIH